MATTVSTKSAPESGSLSTATTSSNHSSSSTSINYELYAPRSELQRNRLSRIQVLTGGPEVGAQKSVKKEKSSSGSLTLTAMSPPAVEEKSISNLFRCGSEELCSTIELAESKAKQLSEIVENSSEIKCLLKRCISLGEDLSSRHSELVRHSGELSLEAERLQAEEDMLTKHANEIGRPLKHYDAIDKIGVQLGVLFKHKARTVVHGLAKLKVDSAEFCKVLDEIDVAYDFFEGQERLVLECHPDGRENLSEQENCTLEYDRRAKALHETALSLIRESTADRMTICTTDITEALQLRNTPISADKLEASLVYTRFHGISSRTNYLIGIVRHRVDKRVSYSDLMNLCRTTYCISREKLLKSTVKAHIDHLKDQHGLVGMTRIASLFMMKIASVETSLYLDFFSDAKQVALNGDSSKKEEKTNQKQLQTKSASFKRAYEDFIFQNTLEKLCNPFTRAVRRALVSMSDLDLLCQIVSVLREEQTTANASRTFLAISRAINIVIQDAQERLIFCANSLLRKEVINFKPSPQDLNYPDKISNPTEHNKDPVQAQLQIYESWFPPMRSVLRVLSKLFRVVEPRVFEDIAQESVQGCTKTLKEAAVHILLKSGVMHADLFLVKHLLILREQLSPFDINLRAVERQLDFSEAGKAMTRFLANRNRQLFSMSTENALVTLLREGVSVQESSVDSKRDLEDALRSACNDFIEHTSMTLAEPILKFVLQCKLSKNADATSTDNSTLFRSQPFMNAANVNDILNQTKQNITKEISEITKQMSIYLDNKATQNILFKPVIKKINRALQEANHILLENTSNGENNWNEEERNKALQVIKDCEDLLVKG